MPFFPFAHYIFLKLKILNCVRLENIFTVDLLQLKYAYRAYHFNFFYEPKKNLREFIYEHILSYRVMFDIFYFERNTTDKKYVIAHYVLIY